MRIYSNMQAILSEPARQKVRFQERAYPKNQSLIRSYLQDISRIPLLDGAEEIELGKKVQKMTPLMEAKTVLEKQLGSELSDQEWAAAVQLTLPVLHVIIQQGERARARMIEANLRLVVSIAKKYQYRGLDLLDLIQEGSMGLKRAAERYDPSMGYRFSTYAYWWIRQGITRAIAEQSHTIRLPVNITEKLNKIKRSQRELSQSLGRTPKISEIAKQLGLSDSEIKEYLQIARQPISLDMRVGEFQDTELKDLIESPEVPPDDEISQHQLKQALLHSLENLPPRHREVIRLRFGLNGEPPLSLQKIGDRLNLSRERVRQLQNISLKKLRERKESLGDYLNS